MSRHLFFGLILAGYLFVGVLYAVYTPDWQAPDEPAHYNYIAQLAAGELPVIRPGDYDEAYRQLVVSSRFDPVYSLESFRYENWQPPLYYLLQTPLFWFFGGALLPLRLFSVLLGAGIVALTYVISLELFNGRRWLALTATAFVAYLPQHVAIMASVNNDSLALLLIAAILLLLVRVSERRPPRGMPQIVYREDLRPGPFLLLGLLLGLGFLTKASVYIMAPLVFVALLWCYRQGGQAGRVLGWTFAPALFLGAVWWIRNLVVYDGFDPLAIAAHDAVVVGQLRTADWVAEMGILPAFWAFLQTTFQSFWGQFGWMGVPMPAWVYHYLAAFTIFVFVGLFVASTYLIVKPPETRPMSWFIMAGAVDLTILVYLFYNIAFVQHQGRYLFPALIPIGIGVAIGLGAWWRPIRYKWPAVRFLLPAGLALAMIGLDLLALFRFIVPALTG